MLSLHEVKVENYFLFGFWYVTSYADNNAKYWGSPRVFEDWRLAKFGDILKTVWLKTQFLRFEDLKTASLCHFYPIIDLDLKTAYHKSEDSKKNKVMHFELKY